MDPYVQAAEGMILTGNSKRDFKIFIMQYFGKRKKREN